MGADCLTYPSAFTYETGKAHWKILLQARAIETQCFVIAAAQVGNHSEKRKSYGHGMVVDPWGTILCECLDGSDENSIQCVDIDLTRIESVRKGMPVFNHRRTDVY